MSLLSPIITRTAAAYLSAILRLLPVGAAWPRSPASSLYKICAASAEEYARLDWRTSRLMEEADPRTVTELLDEWEAAFGLPDPCAGQAATIVERRERLVAKVTMVGGQSIPYYLGLAAKLGFTITVAEHKTLQCGDPCGSNLGGWAWNFVWDIHAAQTNYRHLCAGIGRAGEPLATWGNEVLACMIHRLKPAHTHVRFIYN
ncbi:YmfQ family protein [Rhodospirillum sp. A1_3_36]|uniref:YmfQ family protein n=1 Tax=Rhodospirillum sp. A1_3_36 TaxID=3391666 RepID=UPI0039A55280